MKRLALAALVLAAPVGWSVNALGQITQPLSTPPPPGVFTPSVPLQSLPPPQLTTPPAPVPLQPHLNTFGDRVKECLHYGSLSGIPADQLGTFVGACAN